MELLHHHLHWSWSRCLRLILSVPSCASLLSPVVVLFLLLLLLLCRHIVFVFFSMACAAYNNIYNSIYSHPYTDDVPTFHWYGSWFHSYRLFWATFFCFSATIYHIRLNATIFITFITTTTPNAFDTSSDKQCLRLSTNHWRSTWCTWC